MISTFSLCSPNRTSSASGGSLHTQLSRIPFTLPASLPCQGSRATVLPPSPLPPLSTCLAKGFHSAEASFLCTRHKQLFLQSRLLMLPGELADHFLLTDITPPRNNSLPRGCISKGARTLCCQGQQGHWGH